MISKLRSQDLNSKYSPQLDGLRFICFIGVFLGHCNYSTFAFLGFFFPVFFLLSGFLITKSLVLLQNTGTFRRVLLVFYTHRFLRTIPPYLLVTLILFLTGSNLPYWNVLTYTFNFSLFQMAPDPQQLLKLHGIVTGVSDQGHHLWSMSVEEQFYILYPFLILLFDKKGRFAGLMGIIVTCILYRVYMITIGSNNFYGALFFGCGEYILWGAISYLVCIYYGDKLKKLKPETFWASGLVAYGILYYLGSSRQIPGFIVFLPPVEQTLYCICFSLVVLGLWYDDRSIVSKIMGSRLLTYLGKATYGIYLFHTFSWRIVDKFNLTNEAAIILCRLGLSILFGALSWEIFEKPIYSLRKYIKLTS